MNGYNDEKISLIINEVIGFPKATSYEGGYDFIGIIEVYAGNYHAIGKNYFLSVIQDIKQLEIIYCNLSKHIQSEFAHIFVIKRHFMQFDILTDV